MKLCLTIEVFSTAWTKNERRNHEKRISNQPWPWVKRVTKTDDVTMWLSTQTPRQEYLWVQVANSVFHTDESLIPEPGWNDKFNPSVLVTDLLLWGETMTKAAYRGKHVTEAWIQFQSVMVGNVETGMETWRRRSSWEHTSWPTVRRQKRQTGPGMGFNTAQLTPRNWQFEWECPP